MLRETSHSAEKLGLRLKRREAGGQIAPVLFHSGSCGLRYFFTPMSRRISAGLGSLGASGSIGPTYAADSGSDASAATSLLIKINWPMGSQDTRPEEYSKRLQFQGSGSPDRADVSTGLFRSRETCARRKTSLISGPKRR